MSRCGRRRLLSTAALFEAQCGFARPGWRKTPLAPPKAVDAHVIAVVASPPDSWSTAAHLTAPLDAFHAQLCRVEHNQVVKVSLAQPASSHRALAPGSFILARPNHAVVIRADAAAAADAADVAQRLARVVAGLAPLDDGSLAVESLGDRRILFVCCHGAVDRRCGVCGPKLLAQIAADARVEAHAISHVGQHESAPNVMALHRGRWLWFGFVALEQARDLTDWLAAGADPLANVSPALRPLVRGTHFA